MDLDPPHDESDVGHFIHKYLLNLRHPDVVYRSCQGSLFTIGLPSRYLELHKKYHSSQRGLRNFLGKRQGLLAYLSKRNRDLYKELTGGLDIREIKTR